MKLYVVRTGQSRTPRVNPCSPRWHTCTFAQLIPIGGLIEQRRRIVCTLGGCVEDCTMIGQNPLGPPHRSHYCRMVKCVSAAEVDSDMAVSLSRIIPGTDVTNKGIPSSLFLQWAWKQPSGVSWGRLNQFLIAVMIWTSSAFRVFLGHNDSTSRW